MIKLVAFYIIFSYYYQNLTGDLKMKKILLMLSLSLFSLTAFAANLNDVIQTFPVQLTADDQSSFADGSGENIDRNVVAYNTAYMRVMNQNIMTTLTDTNGKNLNVYINTLYNFAGMAYTAQGTSLNDNIASTIKGGFNLSQGENKYLYQEQANIYNLIQKGTSPSQVKNYIDTNSKNVLSGVVQRGKAGIQTTPNSPNVDSSANQSSSGQDNQSTNQGSGGGFKLNY